MAQAGVGLELGPNGATLKYALSEDVLIETLNPFPPNDRTTGTQRRSDKINGSQQVIESLRHGIGYYRTVGQPPNDSYEEGAHPSYSAMFDSKAETRWEGQVTRPPKITAGTVTNATHDYRKLINTVYGETLVLSRTADESIGIWNYDTNTVDQDRNMTEGWAQTASCEHEGYTYIFSGTGSGDIILKFTGTSYDTLDPTAAPTVVLISAVSFRGTLYGLGHDSSNRVLEIWKSTDDGDNWTQLSGCNVTEKPRNRAAYGHLVEYLDGNGQPVIYLITDSYVYIFDTVAEEVLPVIKWDDRMKDTGNPKAAEPLTFDPEDGNGLRLYVPRDEQLWEIHYTGRREDVSPFQKGSVASALVDRNAKISSLAVGGGWLFVGYSSTLLTAYVYAYDGFGFHYIWNGAITSGITDSGVVALALHKDWGSGQFQLLILYTTGSAGANTGIVVIDDILLNPLQNSNSEYESSGFIILPYYDGGMSELDAAVVEFGLEALNLDTTANNDDKILFEIDRNYSGTYESDSDKKVTFYSDSSPVSRQKLVGGNGLSSRAWRIKITISGGAAATDVALLYASVSYNKKSPGIHRYTVLIDLALSVEMDRRKYQSAQDVWSTLHTANNTIPLLDMRIIGSNVHTDTTRRVEIIEWPTFVDREGNPQVAEPQMESGNVRMVLMEMFPE